MATVIYAGCNNKQKFDRTKWYYGDGIDFPYRESMVDDIINSHMLIGQHYPRVIGLLHDPQGKEPGGVFYEVVINYNNTNIHKKLLVVEFSKDSIVNKVYLRETGNLKKSK